MYEFGRYSEVLRVCLQFHIVLFYKNSLPVKLIIQRYAKLSLINEEKAIFLQCTRMFLSDYAKVSL